jgi:flavin reductase (DIM6/NTAB) family NADH-FMN oxidoreductase RutF
LTLQTDIQPSVAPERFRDGMRRVAAACAIITARDEDGQRVGLAATAICSVTADPPRLLVCVNRSVSAHPAIVAAGALGVNIIPDGQHNLIQRFSGGTPREERFAIGPWRTGVSGAPILADALVAFDCRIVEAIAASTHDILLCEVIDLVTTEGGDPMLYFDGAFRSLTAAAGQSQ